MNEYARVCVCVCFIPNEWMNKHVCVCVCEILSLNYLKITFHIMHIPQFQRFTSLLLIQS